MDTYELLLAGHLLTAMAWVGGDFMVQMFYLRAKAAGPEAVGKFATQIEWIGLRIITPTAFLVVVFGVLLVLELEQYSFSQFWISAALGMYLLSFLVGAGFLGPESGRINQLSEERGVEDPEVQRRIARILMVSRIELLLLVLIVIDMVAKPGFP